MKTTIGVAAAAVLLAGCVAVEKQWVAIGGSRSDGTVKLAYDYGGLQQVTVDDEAGHKLAAERCRAWGYTSAEAFGGKLRSCATYNQYGCTSFRMTATYQCTSRK